MQQHYSLPCTWKTQTQTERTLALAEALADARAAEVEGASADADAWMALARARALAMTMTVMQAQAQVRAQTQPLTQAEVQAAVQAATNVWAARWGKARAFTYGEVLADSNLMDIIYSIKLDQHHQFTREIWEHSTSLQEVWWLIQIVSPITRLPLELLQQILFIIIDNASNSPLVLMRVCKHWYTIVTDQWWITGFVDDDK